MKIYVIHSAMSPLDDLKDILVSDNVSIRDSFDFSDSSPISEQILAEIRSVDAVIAVIDGGDTNIFYECGMAVALRKPILALLARGSKLPSFATSITYLTLDLKRKDVLAIAIRRFLAGITGKPFRNPRKTTKLKGPKDERINWPVYGETPGTGSKVEERVSAILRHAGVRFLQQPTTGRDSMADFAVWSDSRSEILGNPILIEVKAALNQETFERAYRRLSDVVRQTDSGAGVLVYSAPKGTLFRKPSVWHPSVIWFDLEEFADALRTKSFDDALIERRNKNVHGLLS